MRSNQPPGRRLNRIFLSKDAPKLQKWDYIVMERNFGVEFNMKYIHPGFRGLYSDFNHPTLAWTHPREDLAVSAVGYPKPPPVEMPEPGEGCLKVALKEGENLLHQDLFYTGPDAGLRGYFGMIEAGKHYVLDVWLMQNGVADEGTVSFTLGKKSPYPRIARKFKVTGEWKKYVYEFDVPPTMLKWKDIFGPSLAAHRARNSG